MSADFLFFRICADAAPEPTPLLDRFCYEETCPTRAQAVRFRFGPRKDILAAQLIHFVRGHNIRVHSVRDEHGNLMHRSIVTAPDFRYPFMNENDLMIGGLWTHPAHRNNGLATWVVSTILSRARAALNIGQLWYVVRSDNAPSIKVAVKNGMNLYSRGSKIARMGLNKLGSFLPDVETTRGVNDYSALTEQWNMPMTPEQVAMVGRRYHWLASHAVQQSVLEIGCGVGMGLDYVASKAAIAVGGDITLSNLVSARRHVPTARVLQMDGEALPFPDHCFDVAAMFEVLYYLHDPDRALREVHRILRPEGILLMCLPNRNRPGFHASPQSTNYYSVPELASALDKAGFEPTIYGAFVVGSGGLREWLVVRLTIAARALRLIPASLSGRSRIKRLVYGPLKSLDRLTNQVPHEERLVELDTDSPVSAFKNLYAMGRAR